MASKKKKAAVLAELRDLRGRGETRLQSYQVEEELPLYDDVDEQTYKNLVRRRLDQDDFVVDDNGEGYADDGREDWEAEVRPAFDTESDSELPLKGKPGKDESLTGLLGWALN